MPIWQEDKTFPRASWQSTSEPPIPVFSLPARVEVRETGLPGVTERVPALTESSWERTMCT